MLIGFQRTGVWKDSTGANAFYNDGADVVFDDTASGVSPIVVTLNQSVSPRV